MFPNQSIRYKLAPQMRKYDSVKHVWKPFIMFFNEANIKSNVLNLDKFGLRFNDLNNLKNLDIEKTIDELSAIVKDKKTSARKNESSLKRLRILKTLSRM